MNEQKRCEILFKEFKQMILKSIAPYRDDEIDFIFTKAVFSGWILASETNDFKISALKNALKEKLSKSDYQDLEKTIEEHNFLSKDYRHEQILFNFYILNSFKLNGFFKEGHECKVNIVEDIVMYIYDSVLTNVDLQAYFDEHKAGYEESPLNTLELIKFGLSLDQIKALYACFGENFKAEQLDEEFEISEVRTLSINDDDDKQQVDDLETLLAKRSRVKRIVRDLGGVLELRKILISNENVGDSLAEQVIITSLSNTQYPLNEIRLLINEMQELYLDNPLGLTQDALKKAIGSLRGGETIAKNMKNVNSDFRAVVGLEVDGQRILYSNDDLEFMLEVGLVIAKIALQEAISPMNTLAV